MTRHAAAAPLAIGVIGAGAIGSWHARIVAEALDARLAGVADIDFPRARALAERFGVAAYPDAAAMFKGERLAGVIVASPDRAHVEHATLAAAAGVPTLIEKPMAPDLGGVAAIEKVANAAGVFVMAGHVERFEIGSAQLKSALDEGVCGRPIVIAARRQFAALDTPRFAGLSTTLRVLAVHDFDLVLWLHPAQVVSVHAAAARGPVHAATGLDDHVATTIRFADGALALVESGWTLPKAYAAFVRPSDWSPAGNNRLEVFGSEGLLSNDMGLRGQQLIAFDAAEGFRAAGIRHRPILNGRVVGALAEEVAAFLRAIREGTPPLVGVEDARRAVALVELAERSLKLGRPCAPDELNGAL